MQVAELERSLTAAGQQHVLRFWDQLAPAGRTRLLEQLRTLDLNLLQQLTTGTGDQVNWAALARRAEPPSAICLDDPRPTISPGAARRAGTAALHAGHVGIILVAGGQGTRLGFPHPKGTFPIGPVSGHSIFQILFERVAATARRYGAPVPVFVMTSPATHVETVAFLEQHAWFGLPASDVTVFCQGTMPAVDARTGQLLLAAKDALARAPDGHGGLLKALATSGSLETARQRGIQYFSYGQIDNPLVQIGQPELIGYHILAQSEMTSQVIRKNDPLDRVGNVVMIDDQMHVIEYSDLPDDVARLRNPDGTLTFWAGSIAVHVFDRAFLERCAAEARTLPFHRARKKVPFIDPDGVRNEPDAPNAIKFEQFIFDLLPHARNALVVEGRRSEVFAPVKNAEGSPDDTPTAVRQAMMQLHRAWLRAAGIPVPDDVPVEIGPLWALDADQVAARATDLGPVNQPLFVT